MKRALSGLAAAGALWLSPAVPPPLPAQTERTSVEEIARRSAEAQGGSERLRALRSLKLTGSVVTPPVDEGGGSAPKAASKLPALPVVFYLKLPDRVRMEMRAGGNTVVEVVTRESAHSASAGTLEALVRAILTQLPDLVRPLGERSGGSTLKLGGTERLGEREAYRVEVRHPAAPATQVYVDTTTFLKLKQTDSMDGIDLDTYYGDYRGVAALRLPHAVEYKALGNQTIMAVRLEKIEIDPEIDDALFRPK